MSGLETNGSQLHHRLTKSCQFWQVGFSIDDISGGACKTMK